jgi:crotonobetainyl-CoA:carnitine CoA-transferase CaiB-like acyl-CoA transferase
MPSAHTGPLQGVRVLEFSLIFSAPYAGMHLADFGAEVIKVEPPGGEQFRNRGTVVPGHSKIFQSVNRGKRSLVLDLARPEGREVVYRLLPSIDVVLLNYRAGVADRLGIGYEQLRPHRPDLIYGEITGFHPDGPNAHKAASDMIAQAYGGTLAAAGKVDEHGAPVWPSLIMGDFPAGMSMVMGILAALLHRERTGEGQRLGVSLVRTVMTMNNAAVNVEPVNDAHGRDLVKAELDRLRAEGASYGRLVAARQELAAGDAYWRGYSAADGGIVLGALTPANREAVRKVFAIEDDPMDREGYDPADPATQAKLVEIRERVAARMRERSVEEWVQLLEEAGAPVAPVVFPEDLPDHPEGTLHYTDLVHEVTGPQRFVAPVVEMSATPTQASPAPLAGADTTSVLGELGGFSAAEIEALRAGSVVE